MEVAGVRDIFMRSQENYGIRYKYYLGDGDSKGFGVMTVKSHLGMIFKCKSWSAWGTFKKEWARASDLSDKKIPSLNCLMEKLLVAKLG